MSNDHYTINFFVVTPAQKFTSRIIYREKYDEISENPPIYPVIIFSSKVYTGDYILSLTLDNFWDGYMQGYIGVCQL